VEVMKLFEDRFLLAAHEGTQLVDPQHYRFNRLNAGTVLLLRDGHCMREHAIDACRIRDTQKVSRFAASSLLTLIEMVDADLGVTFLPEMAVGSAMLQRTAVKTYPLSDKSRRQIGAIWRRGSARAAEFRELAGFIAEHRNG
jgi:LysR family transcriptional regulator, hydrogen peroxide-inducible genes activator